MVHDRMFRAGLRTDCRPAVFRRPAALRFGQRLDAFDGADQSGEIRWHDHRALLVRGRQLAECLDIFQAEEVVQRVDVALRNGLGDRGRRPASACAARSRASASRKAASRRPSASRICDCFWPSAFRMADCSIAFGFKDLGALFSRSAFICRAIASDDVGWRGEILDLDPCDFDAPGMGRGSRSPSAAAR